MVYFNDDEVKVLKDMLEYYDSYSDEVPRECAELIGAIRFKVDSERVYDATDIEDGVAE